VSETDEKRMVEVQELIDSVPMRVATEQPGGPMRVPKKGKLSCSCCGASQELEEGDEVALEHEPSCQYHARSFEEEVEAEARELAWAALPEMNRAVFRKDAQRKVTRTPRKQVKLPGVDETTKP